MYDWIIYLLCFYKRGNSLYGEKYIDKNKNINRGFRKLEVWKEAIELYSFIKKAIKDINQISFKVKAQIEDSALSVSSNIAEGYCRRYLKENIRRLVKNWKGYAL